MTRTLMLYVTSEKLFRGSSGESLHYLAYEISLIFQGDFCLRRTKLLIFQGDFCLRRTKFLIFQGDFYLRRTKFLIFQGEFLPTVQEISNE